MKFNILTLVFLYSLATCSGCKPATPEPDPGVDTSLDCRNMQEAGMYQTFFKPANGETGDPMPYYSTKDKTFYCFFLLEPYDGSAFRNHIFLTKTKDFSSFGAVTETFPTGDDNAQDQWIGTGSCIEKDNKYYFWYSGMNGKFAASQVAMLATSTDLNTWTKVPSATFEAPDGYDKREFRDPCTYWDETRNKYVMLVAGRRNNRAVLVRYQSDDLTNWSQIETITATTSENPQEFEIQTDSEMLECPDIFRIGDKWYLVFSRINRDVHRKTFYRIADNPNGPWTPCKDENGHHETFDGLYLYAAKTVSDGTNRYISGWASSGDKFNATNELDWGGMLVTHKLVQQSNGKLYPVIPDAVDAKFSQIVDYKDLKQSGNVTGAGSSFTLNGGKVVFNRNASSFKIEMKIDASQADKNFGISFGACDNQSDTYDILFDLTSGNQYGTPALFMYNDDKERNFTPLIVPDNKIFNVKIVAEKSVCVVYVNNNVAFANRISTMNQNPWMIFADEGTVKFSDIKILKQ